MRRWATVATSLLGLLGACAGEMGLGLPQQWPGETYPGDRGEIAGIMKVAANGCNHIELDANTYFVIWPAGSRLGVVLPNGEVVLDGTTVNGIGALTPTAPLVAEPHGYWAHAIGFCAPDADEVLVLDSARRAG